MTNGTFRWTTIEILCFFRIFCKNFFQVSDDEVRIRRTELALALGFSNRNNLLNAKVCVCVCPTPLNTILLVLFTIDLTSLLYTDQ